MSRYLDMIREPAHVKKLTEAQLEVLAGEVREDIRVDHMADLLMEINFVYTNRQLHTGMAIGDELAEAVSRCLFGAVAASAPRTEEDSR